MIFRRRSGVAIFRPLGFVFFAMAAVTHPLRIWPDGAPVTAVIARNFHPARRAQPRFI
jgi:hypothetical protein